MHTNDLFDVFEEIKEAIFRGHSHLKINVEIKKKFLPYSIAFTLLFVILMASSRVMKAVWKDWNYKQKEEFNELAIILHCVWNHMTDSCKCSRYRLEGRSQLWKLKENSPSPAKKPVLQAVLQPLHRLPDTFQPADHHETNQSTHNLTERRDKTTLAIIQVSSIGRLRVVCPRVSTEKPWIHIADYWCL